MKYKTYVIDIDGTISNCPMGQYELSVPMMDRIEYINELYDKGHTIKYLTARGMGRHHDIVNKVYEQFYELTEQQLQEWGCKYHALEVGNKPHFNVYICDKSINADEFFSLNKKEWATLRSKWIKNGDKKG